MNLRRESVVWGGLAVAALLLLVATLGWQYNANQRRWAIQVTPRPLEGRAVFREKGCANCHGDSGAGSPRAPGLRQPSPASLPQLVTALWNHAPRMWAAMHEQNLPYPELSYEETGQLVAYLYISGYTDAPGDAARGQQLFRSRHCARCHEVSGGGEGRGPDVITLAKAESPITWTQVLWNHASAMEARMRQLGITWPRFQANELNDLFAYVRQASGHADREPPLPWGDPDRGWKIFQAKMCIRCHALQREQGAQSEVQPAAAREARPATPAPVLGPSRSLPPTFSQFGEAMLNHFPDMRRAMRALGTEPPTFQAQEMADLAVFLYSLHYLEPAGSPHVGASLFVWRGCSQCHGEQAEGTRRGPALRGTGHTYTAIRLATDLWRHGSRMYEQSRKLGQPWPVLQETDVGDLLAFLNTPLERGR
jgi:mono/diheme cytochrome c family protein